MIVMDHDNYVKMRSILGDRDKFIKLGLAKIHERMKSTELNFQKHLLNLIKNKVLLVDIYEVIKPVGFMMV